MTTRTDGVTDTGSHRHGRPLWGGSGAVLPADRHGGRCQRRSRWMRMRPAAPSSPNSGSFRQYEVVRLTAQVKDGYRIKRWVGTGNDTTKDPNILITVMGPMDIKIEFEKIPVYRLTTKVSSRNGSLQPDYHRVAGLYPRGHGGGSDGVARAHLHRRQVARDRQRQVLGQRQHGHHDRRQSGHGQLPPRQEPGGPRPVQDDSAGHRRTPPRHGDKIVVLAAHTYQTSITSISGGKAIILTSENPTDPYTVAHTIIDCNGGAGRSSSRTAKAPDAVIQGFTIRNGLVNGRDPNAPPGRRAPMAWMHLAARLPASREAVRRWRTW